jgi:hypothetical protein
MKIIVFFVVLLLFTATIVTGNVVYAQTTNVTNPLAKAIITGLGFNQKCPGSPGILGLLGVQYTAYNTTSGKCDVCFIHGVGFGIVMQKLQNLMVQKAMKQRGIQHLTPLQNQTIMNYENKSYCRGIK